MRRLIQVMVLALLLFSAACMNIYTPTPAAPTATLPALATFTPRYTATPIPTPSPRPTFTYTPSLTPIPPSPTDSPTPTPTPPTIGRVSSVQVAVRLREGPGTTFPVIQGVPVNTEVIILAQNEDQRWYNVRLEDGTEGWMAANLVYVLPTLTPLPTSTAPGVVLEVSGTPVATALLGGQPITATPSFTPMIGETAVAAAPTLITPGTITATPSSTATLRPGAGIPTITPGLPSTPTLTATSPATPTANGTVLAPGRRFNVLAYCEQFHEVPPPLAAGTTINVFWGWFATTQEYLQQHLDNVIYEVRFDGQLLSSWRRYADQARQRPNGDWEIYWYVPIEEPLSSGTHTITYRVTWRDAVFDGYRWFGPGTETEFEAGNCSLEVR